MSETGDVSRRDALKLAAGAAALGASLGIPRAALALSAEGAPAYEFYLKFYQAGRLVQSVPMNAELSELMATSPGSVVGKFWRSPTEVVGSVSIPPEVQLKFRAANTTLKISR